MENAIFNEILKHAGTSVSKYENKLKRHPLEDVVETDTDLKDIVYDYDDVDIFLKFFLKKHNNVIELYDFLINFLKYIESNKLSEPSQELYNLMYFMDIYTCDCIGHGFANYENNILVENTQDLNKSIRLNKMVFSEYLDLCNVLYTSDSSICNNYITLLEFVRKILFKFRNITPK